ncbi:MAG: hypothetical protein IT529_21050 [Burkholderiales bacterium]|nr:hypothetical protein [Burkholderiales bacterium]
MDDNCLKIPKKPVAVALRVHSEGQVIGSLFRHVPTADCCRDEQPRGVMNEKTARFRAMRPRAGCLDAPEARTGRR